MAATRRRIAIVTGSRADYGLLRETLNLLRAAKDVELQVVACGMHLAEKFGSTWRAIEADGFPIAAKIDFELGDDSATAVARSTGFGVTGFSAVLPQLKPDVVVLLGDRYEMLAARRGGHYPEHPDRAHSWRRNHCRRFRRRYSSCHHENGLPAFCRRRTLPAARHPDGRRSGLRFQRWRTGHRSGGHIGQYRSR